MQAAGVSDARPHREHGQGQPSGHRVGGNRLRKDNTGAAIATVQYRSTWHLRRRGLGGGADGGGEVPIHDFFSHAVWFVVDRYDVLARKGRGGGGRRPSPVPHDDFFFATRIPW